MKLATCLRSRRKDCQLTTEFRIRSAVERHAAVVEGSVSVHTQVQEDRREILRYEPRLEAWTELAELTDSDAADLRGGDAASSSRPLAGISVGVKDIIDVGGMPTRCGSHTSDPTPAAADATCVARLRELGATVQGKTVTTEYGYFAPGPTTNPYSTSATPGGSSSGSAAAVGAGTVQLALGTQTAGSLTRPASYCGAAGLVVTHDSIPLDGVTGLSSTLDSLGFLTQTVEDLSYIWHAYHDLPVPGDDATLPDTVYLWEGTGVLNVESTMSQLLHEVPSLLEELGIASTPLDWDDHVRSLCEDHRTVMSYEAARGIGLALGNRTVELSTQLQELLTDGTEVTDSDAAAALFRRDNSSASLSRMLGDRDVIIGPAAGGPAPDRTTGTGSPELSRPWQLMGLPVLTVPGARTGHGLPLGLQIIGGKHSEDLLLALGSALEPRLRALPSFTGNTTSPTLKEMTW